MKKQRLRSAPPAPEMEFKVEGDGDFNPTKTPKAVIDAIAVLGKLSDGAMLRRRGLAMRMNVSETHLSHFTAHPALKDYRLNYRNEILLGNLKTIAAARKQYAI